MFSKVKKYFRNVDVYNEEEYNKLNQSEKNKIFRPYFGPSEDLKKGVVVDGQTSHKRRNYEKKYNKLFRKFEYDKVMSMSLSTNIR